MKRMTITANLIWASGDYASKIDPERFRAEYECQPTFEPEPKFWKWYERNAHKYYQKNPGSSEEDRRKLAYRDWCER